MPAGVRAGRETDSMTADELWLIRNIDDDAVSRAERAAHNAGLTLAEWISRAIIDSYHREAVAGDGIAPSDRLFRAPMLGRYRQPIGSDDLPPETQRLLATLDREADSDVGPPLPASRLPSTEAYDGEADENETIRPAHAVVPLWIGRIALIGVVALLVAALLWSRGDDGQTAADRNESTAPPATPSATTVREAIPPPPTEVARTAPATGIAAASARAMAIPAAGAADLEAERQPTPRPAADVETPPDPAAVAPLETEQVAVVPVHTVPDPRAVAATITRRIGDSGREIRILSGPAKAPPTHVRAASDAAAGTGAGGDETRLAEATMREAGAPTDPGSAAPPSPPEGATPAAPDPDPAEAALPAEDDQSGDGNADEGDTGADQDTDGETTGADAPADAPADSPAESAPATDDATPPATGPRPADDIGDMPRGVAAFARAAEAGDPDAQHDLALIYVQGRGVPRDYETAAYWFRQAADQGNANAQYNLGVMHERGLGVGQDSVEALLLYLAAAEQGHVAAQYNAGLAYAEGRSVPRNFAEARRWFAAAAEQGLPEAQYNLGIIYENGFGVPRDDLTAYRYYGMAGAAGHEAANKKVESVGARLTATERAEAERLVRESVIATVRPQNGDEGAASRRDRIREVQERLAALGYEPGPADGIVGRQTAAAIRRYQQEQGLAVDGRPTADLLGHLRQQTTR